MKEADNDRIVDVDRIVEIDRIVDVDQIEMIGVVDIDQIVDVMFETIDKIEAEVEVEVVIGLKDAKMIIKLISMFKDDEMKVMKKVKYERMMSLMNQLLFQNHLEKPDQDHHRHHPHHHRLLLHLHHHHHHQIIRKRERDKFICSMN